MKNLLLMISLCLSSVISNATTYYISPTGSDSNPGTLAAPFKTWERISAPRWSNLLQPGDIVYIRGGVYSSPHATNGDDGVACYWSGINGSVSQLITIMNYPGEHPILDCSNMLPNYSDPMIITMRNCSYMKVIGLEIKNLKQVSTGLGISRGFEINNCSFITLNQISLHNVGGDGYQCINSYDITYNNCDAYELADNLSVNGDGSDDSFENANGFDKTNSPSSRITYNGCRAWLISDDCFENFLSDGTSTYNNCWAFLAGYYRNPSTGAIALCRGNGEGFKLGPTATIAVEQTKTRFLNNCLAFDNKSNGFNQNGADYSQGWYTTLFQLYNCTAFRNGDNGFEFGFYETAPGQAFTFRNNISYANGAAIRYYGANTYNTNNTWSGGVTVNDADFLSVSSAGTDGARQSDGSLPNINFLKLAAGSDLINKGLNVGLPFISTAPDLGAFESNGSTSNISPTANAGADQTVALPTSSVNLTGSGTDPDGSVSTYLWTKTSGPTSGTITSIAVVTTTVTGLAQGTYQFQLTVTDNAGASTTDIMQVTVNAAPVNIPPIANAGADKTITLPTNSVSITGTGTDAGGSIASYLWTKISGPTGGTIATATTATTSITGLLQGVYQFELKVTDNAAAVGRDTVQVTVNAAGNLSPTANAGTDKTIVLPISTVSLTGTGTDADGSISAYLWTKISGPTGGTIATATAATTSITALAQGVYKFELKVTDNAAAVGRDTVQVTVNAAGNQAPTANAGADKTITLPTSSVSLTGTGIDVDGSITAYAWSRISGPTAVTVASPTSATTSVSGLVQGVYKFEFRVSDNGGAIGRDTVQVTVNAAATPNNAYGGVRWAIPGKIEAENYDVGGQNIGYYETTTGNAGGLYRTSATEDVDITTSTDGGYLVGWSIDGEWMNYSVNVTTAGTYSLEARIACTAAGKSFRVEMDGTTIATVNPPVTGGNQNWQTVTIPNINLTAGNKIMRIYWVTAWGVNINYLKFNLITTTGVKLAEARQEATDAETTVNTFPLPFSTSFTVNLYGETTGLYNLNLVDASGNSVWKKQVNKTGASLTETIYMGNLPAGVYILQIISPDQKKTTRTLIKN